MKLSALLAYPIISTIIFETILRKFIAFFGVSTLFARNLHFRRNLDVAVFGAAVFDERVNELGLNEIRCIKLIENETQISKIFTSSRPGVLKLGVGLVAHLRFEIVLDTSQHCETGNQNCVRIISFGRVFAKLDKAIDTSEPQQIPTHG